MSPLSFRSVALVCLLACQLPATVLAGNFGVSPIRLDLGKDARTGAITVSNDDEQKPLQVQMRLFAWEQDENGGDHYQESQELVWFPRIMTLAPKESRLVRVGIRSPSPNQERSYRLYVEEIPEPNRAQTHGAQVAIAVRFGIPVFVAPLKQEAQGEIEEISMTRDKLNLRIRNSGNVHLRIEAIRLKSTALEATETAGWYLLPGSRRSHTLELPTSICYERGHLDLEVKTDKLTLSRSIEVKQSMCR